MREFATPIQRTTAYCLRIRVCGPAAKGCWFFLDNQCSHTAQGGSRCIE